MCCRRLIARNVHKLFSSNRGVSHFYAACCIDELSRGVEDMAQALTQWQHTVASRIALDVIHWAMRIMRYRCIAMAIKTANNLSAFFIIVDFVVTHNCRYIDHAMVHII